MSFILIKHNKRELLCACTLTVMWSIVFFFFRKIGGPKHIKYPACITLKHETCLQDMTADTSKNEPRQIVHITSIVS